MRTMITDNAAFVRLLLDNACGAYTLPGGITVYRIETCDVAWNVEAYKIAGEWIVLSMTSEPV